MGGVLTPQPPPRYATAVGDPPRGPNWESLGRSPRHPSWLFIHVPYVVLQFRFVQHLFYMSPKHKLANLLPPDVLFQAENAPKPFSAGAPPWIPLGSS